MKTYAIFGLAMVGEVEALCSKALSFQTFSDPKCKVPINKEIVPLAQAKALTNCTKQNKKFTGVDGAQYDVSMKAECTKKKIDIRYYKDPACGGFSDHHFKSNYKACTQYAKGNPYLADSSPIYLMVTPATGASVAKAGLIAALAFTGSLF